MTSRNKQRSKLKNVTRLTAFICAGAVVLSIILSIALENRIYDQYYKIEQNFTGSLNAIVNHLEFNGLDDTAKEMMQLHSDQYTNYSNFIIVDGQYKVLYAANRGHLDDSGYFYAGVAGGQGRGDLYVLNASGELISNHYYEATNEIALLNLSRNLSDKLERALKAAYELAEGDVAVHEDSYGYYTGSSATFVITADSRYSSRGEQTVNYAGFPTKDMHMFYFFTEDDNPMLQRAQRDMEAVRVLQQLFVSIGVIASILYWLLLPVWVFLDASRRGNHPALWSILTLFTNVVGVIVYLVVRPEAHQCPGCKEPVETDFVVCPVCGTKNKELCSACNRVIDDAWNICPYCAAPIDREKGDAPPEGEEGPLTQS